MKSILMAALIAPILGLAPVLAAAPTTAADPPPVPSSLNSEQMGQLRCIAALAIAANDQQRGATGWAGFPWLPDRGKRFAGIVGDRLVEESGQSREAIKAEILAAVARFQKSASGSNAAEAELTTTVRSCIVMMDKIDPPKAPPTIPQCAAMVALAARDAAATGEDQAKAKQLSNIAAILDAKARAGLRAEGKTDRESDVIIGLEREAIAAAAKANRAKGVEDDLDFEHCFAEAAKA